MVNLKQRKGKKWLGYILYGLVLTVVLLFICFPSKFFRDYLVTKADKFDPYRAHSIQDVKPLLPFGLKLLDFEFVEKKDSQKTLFKADELRVRPSIWSILLGSKFYFKCFLYQGNIKGQIHFKNNLQSGPFEMSLDLDGIHLSDNGLLDHRLEGMLSGKVSYNGNFSTGNRSGEADITLSDGYIRLLHPILTLESIRFKKIQARGNVKNQMITLTKIELTGESMNSNASGNVIMKKELMKSHLNLGGTIELSPGFIENLGTSNLTMNFLKKHMRNGKLPYHISGTLQTPFIRFL